MMEDIALIVKENKAALAQAFESKSWRDMLEAHNLQRDSRNYLFLRYGSGAIEEYLKQMKGQAHVQS